MYISPNHPDYERLKGRGPTTAEAPEPSGTLLATFARKGPAGVEQQLRVVLDEFQGHRYVAVRLWQAGQDGAFWPLKGKGVSIRLSEAEGVAAALQKAMGQATPEPTREAHPRRRQRPEGRPQWNSHGSPPPPSGHHDDAY